MDSFDLIVVGGGINGAAIARDAAGRGLDVLLVEKDDLASHTSSASSKLIHGGLRYLEQYEFRLVREVAARALDPASHSAACRAPSALRPARSAGRPALLAAPPRPAALRSAQHRAASFRARAGCRPAIPALKPGFRCAAYWDAMVDDARLVVLNALDARERGAEIATRTELLSARRDGEAWTAELSGGRTVTRSDAGQRRRPLGRRAARPAPRLGEREPGPAGQGQPHPRAPPLGGRSRLYPAAGGRPGRLRASLWRVQPDRHHRHPRRGARGRGRALRRRSIISAPPPTPIS